ncbi:hypothetical protein I4U23_003501 [Adineta vaga]|nr:hypothetical protein I4U23_003501 [Adineta vaga]
MNTTLTSTTDNNLKLRIISVPVILVLSVLGASISIISARVKILHINPIILNVGKFFGSGVILATGFIHMLPAAMDALTDPCLPDSWKAYDASAGLIAMLAVMIMQLSEYIVHQHYRSIQSKTNSTTTVELVDRYYQAKKISTYLLEFGIALHSILIGLALGTADDEFTVLFIALCFHQFFEGMALGAQITRLDRISLRSIIWMITFFAVTTPLGIGIGIVVQSKSYNPKSVTSLLINGILDSVSAGILIYVALVHLIATEMGCHAHAFHSLDNRLKFLYFVALYAGAAAMAVVGIWA